MLRRSLLALLLLPLASPAARADDDDQDRARTAVERGEIRPLSRILGELERRFVGQVVDTDLDRDDGRWVYEFKLLPPSGRMYRVTLDAATGEVLQTRGPVQERR
ncbi:PepSY domain-containing protein [Belnapia sp. T18]|uniref:PepSY domain-containing protein n=1 Tax=Belnapia arida TaxID=2804533 RepID=A0ABS1TXU3_9PROT|nr:PepSY domain-containing protein [Belnapia arida]MBL6077253.1 PepSY domain-containing protein [Belnapia arida]